MQDFVIVFCLNAALGTSFWKGLLQMQTVLECSFSLLGVCFVLGLLLQASLSLDTEARVQMIPNAPETFLSCSHILFLILVQVLFLKE